MRLVGGSSTSEGRVEFCSDQQWGTVCDDFWGMEDARVICRQLGYSTISIPVYDIYVLLLIFYVTYPDATAVSNAHFGRGTGSIFLDNVACVGSEANLTSCVADLDTRDCTHADDAGVTCVPDCELTLCIPRVPIHDVDLFNIHNLYCSVLY